LAVVPIYFLSPLLREFFAGRGRIISYGIPLTISTIAYILLGIALLAIVRDQNLLAFVKMVRKRGKSL